MAEYKKKLIEVALPLEEINAASAREKSIRHGHPSTLHLWWARRPLAACRAVLFAQLVDDPSAHPDQFPTEEAQEKERERLFDIIRELVKWENTNNEKVLKQAHAEILKSCDGKPPAVYDPFSGGGSIPLEAQRLGLEAYGSDLNPVAVMIGKALIEIPPKFAGMPPINPEYRATHDVEKELTKGLWTGAKGLAEDVRYYGKWMRDRAFEKIGHLYPPVELPDGSSRQVIGWIWARTVASPNPALKGIHVPLVSSFLLSAKKGKEAWIEPIISDDGRSYEFKVNTKPVPSDKINEIKLGTKTARGANFRCLLSNTPITSNYIKEEGVAGRLGTKLLAVVAEGSRKRTYYSPASTIEQTSQLSTPSKDTQQELPQDPRNFWTPSYGLTTYQSLFCDRQLVALDVLSALVSESRNIVLDDIKKHKLEIDDSSNLSEREQQYADAIATYVAFAIDKFSDYSSTVCSWTSARETVRSTFARQAIPMTWDFIEVNPFSSSTGNFLACLDWVWKVVAATPASTKGKITHGDSFQNSAQSEINLPQTQQYIVSTDPPYYDNISYSDLSDFFYIWLRRSLKSIYSKEFSTLITPKEPELVAHPYRHGGQKNADAFFMKEMTHAVSNIQSFSSSKYPITIYYAFKQSESKDDGVSSTGWETFLEAVIRAGLSITAFFMHLGDNSSSVRTSFVDA